MKAKGHEETHGYCENDKRPSVDKVRLNEAVSNLENEPRSKSNY